MDDIDIVDRLLDEAQRPAIREVCQEAANEIERLRAEVDRLMDGMEWAWTIIANGQYWDATDAVRHPEWEQAKFKWRDEHWHPALDRNKEARRG